MADSAEVRRKNKNLIRRIMWQGGEFTKQGIAARTRLSVATCNTLLNELEADGEILGEKKRFQDVGRSSIAYHMNEEQDLILGIDIQYTRGLYQLSLVVLSITAQAKRKVSKQFDHFTVEQLVGEIAGITTTYPSITQIIVGITGEIPGLHPEELQKVLEERFHCESYVANDIHLKVYGYYKQEGKDEDIISLTCLSSNCFPKTATIHSGEIIKGHDHLAGMIGFLPFDMDRKEQIVHWQKGKCKQLLSKTLCSIIVMLNPGKMLLTGDLIEELSIEEVNELCLSYLPEEFLPEFIRMDDMEEYYLSGIYECALERKLKSKIMK